MKIKNKRYVRKYSISKVKDTAETFLTWDTETDGFNGALKCITYDDGINPDLLSGPNMVSNFIDHILNFPYPYVWIAHNAQYDWRYIIKELIERNFHITFLNRTDSDIFQITIWTQKPSGISKFDKDIPKIVMRDSFALFPQSLADFVKFYAPHKKKLDIDLESVRFNLNNPQHCWYAINDSIILREAMNGFSAMFNSLFGCYPAMTTAGSAMKAWQNTLTDEFYCITREQEEYIDSAYYGGIVFLTDTNRHEQCRTYDINSSYPSQMLDHPVPYGKPSGVKELIRGKLGFYTIIVETPKDLIIPILPSRDDKGNMIWRSGKFQTTVSTIELEFALEHGYILHDVLHGVIFDEQAQPFKVFIERCKFLRKKYKGTAIEQIAKLMQNSLYGKYATRLNRQEIYLPIEEADLDDGYCIDGELGIWEREIMDLQMPRMPHWSAWITAQARLDLLRTAYAVGPDNVLYGDTDSLTIKSQADDSKIPQHESEYGYFKLEKTWDHFQAIAPKVYAGRIAGKLQGKVKGIPKNNLTENYLKDIINGTAGIVHFESVPKLTAILKGKAEAGHGTQERKRSLSSLQNSQNWQAQESGAVRPRVAS